MNIPPSIRQGDTVAWRDVPAGACLGDELIVPADWTLTYYLVGQTKLAITGDPVGEGWDLAMSAEQTATLSAGGAARYEWQAVASRDGQAVTLGTGRLRVLPGLQQLPAGFDGRSHAERCLAQVTEVIECRLKGGAVTEYTIGGRRLAREPLAELIKLQRHFQSQVASEAAALARANGLPDPRHSYVRFT